MRLATAKLGNQTWRSATWRDLATGREPLCWSSSAPAS